MPSNKGSHPIDCDMEAVQHGMVERVEAEHVALLAEQATGVRGENFKEYEVSLRPSRGQADADEEGNKRLDAPSASTIAFRSEIRAVCDIEAQGQPVSCWRVRPEGARYSGEKASNLKSAVFTLPREAIVYNGSSPVEALAALGHNTGFAFVREGWRFWCKQRTVSGGWIRIQIFQARPLRDPLDPTSALDPLVRAFCFAFEGAVVVTTGD